MKTKATVRVRVVIGVSLTQPWGDACTVKQVRDQGVKEAEDAVRCLLQDAKGMKMLGVEALEMTVTDEAER